MQPPSLTFTLNGLSCPGSKNSKEHYARKSARVLRYIAWARPLIRKQLQEQVGGRGWDHAACDVRIHLAVEHAGKARTSQTDCDNVQNTIYDLLSTRLTRQQSSYGPQVSSRIRIAQLINLPLLDDGQIRRWSGAATEGGSAPGVVATLTCIAETCKAALPDEEAEVR